MKCAVHPDVDAVGFCRNCGKPMCPVCVRPVRDVLYCEDCLANVMGHIPAAANAANPGAVPGAVPGPIPGAVPGSVPGTVSGIPPAVSSNAPSPMLAFFLGFLPGLGAFYNEQYGKGVIHLAIFMFLFILGVDGDIGGGAKAALWLCIIAFWIFMAIDAFRTAKAKQAGYVLSDPLESFSKGRPIGPILVIAVGALLLLHNFDWFPFYRLHDFWPIILIVVGIVMFRSRLSNRS
ncbi:MAG TPA: B-box zinc finger protein [Candidatus Acidoferrum sp.]